MSPALSLRVACDDDTLAIVALVNSAYRGDSSKAGWTTEADLLGGQRVDPQGIAHSIARPGNVILLHPDAGDLVACVHLERTGDDGYLGMFTVRPTAQGAGLGGRLLAAAEHWATDHWQVRAIHMTVIVQRTELIDWYLRRGYSRTGEHKPFPYGNSRFGLPRRDDLAFEVLRKRLSP